MVIWTNPAKADLKAIHDFIALDSRFYAKKVTTSVVRKTETLNRFAQIGRVVPEIDNDAVRELFIYSYRIIYEIKSGAVYILAIVHGKQDLASTHLYSIQE